MTNYYAKVHLLRWPLLLAALLPLAAKAQVDFRAGYIVPAAGDTLRGQLDYRDPRANSRQCRFRASAEAPVQVYAPAALRAYGLPAEGQHYRALPLPGSGALTFLQVLEDGPASLYFWRDADGKDHYYLATSTFPLAELGQRRVLSADGTRVQDQPVYRTTLAVALAGCPEVERRLPSLLFSSGALAQAVATYNRCQGKPAASLSRPAGQRQPLRWGVVGGLTVATTKVDNDDTSEHFDFGTSSSFTGGLFLTVPLTQLSRKLALHTELLLEGQHYQQAASQLAVPHRYTLDLTYLRLPVLLRYTAPSGNVRPYVEAGPVLAYALRLDATNTVPTSQGQNTTATTDFYPRNRRPLQEGVSAGLGLQFNYWQGRPATIGGRLQVHTGWTEGASLNTNGWQLHLLAALGLGK